MTAHVMQLEIHGHLTPSEDRLEASGSSPSTPCALIVLSLRSTADAVCRMESSIKRTGTHVDRSCEVKV